jgi:uncharacterized protein YdhG (YjbR/CyaY superfamily)
VSPTKRAKTSATGTSADGFSAEERAAMKERARELKAEARTNRDRAAGEADLLAKIAEMSEPDRSLAARLHEIVGETAPSLAPRTWYGMPAYASEGKVVVFFQGAQKFTTRYATLGFSDQAKLDEGAMWPTSFALKQMTPEVEERIRALVEQAVR